jgi:hypothetical protein
LVVRSRRGKDDGSLPAGCYRCRYQTKSGQAPEPDGYKLIGQPLLIAEVHPGLRPKARNHADNGAAQALILLVFIQHRIGVRSIINSSARNSCSSICGAEDTRRFQWRTISCAVKYSPGLRPAALNLGETAAYYPDDAESDNIANRAVKTAHRGIQTGAAACASRS